MDEEQTVTQEQLDQEHAAVEQALPEIPKQDSNPLTIEVTQPLYRYAIETYQAWLSNQPRQIGPFGVFWNAEEGQALVKQYCEEQGWS